MHPLKSILTAVMATAMTFTAVLGQDVERQQRHADADAKPVPPPAVDSMQAGVLRMMRERLADQQEPSSGTMRQRMGTMDGPTDPVEAAFAAINRRTLLAMDASGGASADTSFAQAMINHQQGAVDMAKVILAFGKDPEIRKMAEEVLKAQQAQITALREWLAKRSQ